MNEATRVAIVTGAGGVLGQAVASTLSGAGLAVVAVDRQERGMEVLPDAVRRDVADLGDPASATALVDRVAAEVGPPDVLVHTVGGFHGGEAADTTPEVLRQMIDLNLGTAWWTTRAVAPVMSARHSGAIVHVAARQGLEPSGGAAAYGVSKAAVVHLVRVLDAELRPHGVRVNAVAPRLLDTPANRAAFPADVMAHAVTPGAVAEVIAFLVSDAAAPVSGAVLPAYGLT